MLKDIINQDVQNVFFNLDELAEMHRIGDKSVRCIIDDDKLSDIAKKYYDGTFTAEKLIYINELEIDSVPHVNESILFDDEIYPIYSVSSEYGILELMLNKPVGKLDKQIIIQRVIGEERINGFPVKQWCNVHQCKAYIRTITGDEIFKRGTEVVTSKILIKIAYTDVNIDEDMRVLYRGKTFNIRQVENIEENNTFIDLVCEVIK